ncbi:hypothetical protein Tco_0146163 [Tanacetum coccineum]
MFDSMHESKSFNKHPANNNLYHALMESLIADENAIDQGVADLIKHKKSQHDDDDRDQDPPAGPDQGLKKRKTSKDAEPLKMPKSTGSSKSNTTSQPKSIGKSVQAEETVFEAADTDVPFNKGDDMGNTDEQPDVEAAPKVDWFKKPQRAPTPDPEWIKGKSVGNEPAQNWLNDLANAENPPLTFDDLLSTPIDFSAFVVNCLKISKLTKADLVGPQTSTIARILRSSHVPADFFFNNDLEYLRGGGTDKKYTASTTKTKAAKYDVEGIEDMVPKLWSPIKVAYDKYAALGISHWGPKRQRFYGYVIKRVSRHDVYSTMRILSVTSVTFDEWYGYGHLKEIVMRRAYQKLYKFMEGDFPRLHLNEIEDMLLLIAQNKLNNLDGNVIVHLAVGLRMYTRRVVIQSRVEDLYLGVESYQKKLNISKPRTRDVDLSRRAPYTTLSETQGVIYKDKLKRKRLMLIDELYKFSDGTLTSVRNTLDQMLKNLRLGYNKDMKRRKWTATDQKRTRIMIKDINQ